MLLQKPVPNLRLHAHGSTKALNSASHAWPTKAPSVRRCAVFLAMRSGLGDALATPPMWPIVGCYWFVRIYVPRLSPGFGLPRFADLATTGLQTAALGSIALQDAGHGCCRGQQARVGPLANGFAVVRVGAFALASHVARRPAPGCAAALGSPMPLGLVRL